jgi:hypothetical protein
VDEDLKQGGEAARIDRRQALKRLAAGGAVLWAIPTIQTIGMRRAFAQGSPGEDCYTVKLQSGQPCEAPSPNANHAQAWSCLWAAGGNSLDLIVTDKTSEEACAKVANFTPNGTWAVTLAPGCHLEAGFSKCGSGSGSCMSSPSPQGSTGTIQFVPCSNGAEINHVEFTICCEPTD